VPLTTDSLSFSTRNSAVHWHHSR